ncbi:MAG: dephospho-CoA kinase [Nitrospirae bacterium]|nr:dephospho-CoA kinase [Nitrospirota bacterium]
MLIVGLTGGVASGKTLAAGCFAALGAEVIDADQIAREVVRPGTPAWEAIIRRFGREYLLPDGYLDRKKLGAIVFADPERRQILEAIIHPLVFAETERRIREIASRDPHAFVVLNVPLLFEAGRHLRVDKVVVVWAPEEEQILRIRQRDGLSREEALLRIRAQIPLEEKRGRADYVIDNSGPSVAVRPQVEQIYADLKPYL